jgi:hypothetical protein
VTGADWGSAPARPSSDRTPKPQGILSSFFYKFADTILKKYSSTIATIFTALMSWAMFAHPLTVNFAIGVSIVFVSMHQFFTFTDKAGPAKGAAAAAGNGAVALAASSARGPPAPQMIHSPSMDQFRVAAGPPSGNGGLSTLAEEGADEYGEGLALGGPDGSRAPLLPR